MIDIIYEKDMFFMQAVPGCNDFSEDLQKTAELLGAIPAVRSVKPLAYHDMARSKYEAIGKKDTMPNVSAPAPEFLQKISDLLNS